MRKIENKQEHDRLKSKYVHDHIQYKNSKHCD